MLLRRLTSDGGKGVPKSQNRELREIGCPNHLKTNININNYTFYSSILYHRVSICRAKLLSYNYFHLVALLLIIQIGMIWHFLECLQKKNPPGPLGLSLRQTLPFHAFLQDATSKDYNEDPSTSFNLKKSCVEGMSSVLVWVNFSQLYGGIYIWPRSL